MSQTGSLQQRLFGQHMPDFALPTTSRRPVSVAALEGTTVLYAYPRTSPPGGTAIPGWDQIPGAKGCTPQSCGFRDLHADLLAAGATRMFGLSVQDTEYQQEVKVRLDLPFDLLSDADFMLCGALDLPTFDAAGMTFLERFSMIVNAGRIAHVAHPIADPTGDAEHILSTLRDHN